MTHDLSYPFQVVSDYEPAGDQPTAIKILVEGVQAGLAHQTLLGVTGSGKTFTVAKVIEEIKRPTIVMAHNKTLAAQLYGEFKEFFPHNAVEYFVSIMIIISRKLTFPPVIHLSKKMHQSMTTSSRCGYRQPRHFSSVTMSSS